MCRCHLIQCEILIPLIDPDGIIDGSRLDKYVCFIMKPYPEAAPEPPPDISKNRYLKSQGSGLYRKMCMNEWISVYIDLGLALWQDVLLHTHPHTHNTLKHTHLKMDSQRKHTKSAHSKRKYIFHVSVPYDLVSLPELITEERSGGIGGNEKETWLSDCWS